MRNLVVTIEAKGCSKLGAVLHAGAGTCRELEECIRLNADRILLVEANPELVARLQARVRGIPQATVLGTAIAATAGSAELWVLNNPAESSLLQPTQLLKQYPNLKVARKVTVQAVTLENVIRQLAPDPTAENLLVLELQGLEHSVLTTTPSALLQRFSWVVIRASTAALYDSSRTLTDVDAVLQKSGFDPVTPLHADVTLPFQVVLYHRATLKIKLQSLRKSMEQQSLQEAEVRKKASRSIQELQDSITVLKAELRERDAGESALKKDLLEARQSALLNVKLQALREADLNDLQGRYKDALLIQNRQHQMLVKLGERLSVASQYFHQLESAEAKARVTNEGEMPSGKQVKRTRATRSRKTGGKV